MEMAPAEKLFKNPLHPYTKALISAIPNTNPTVKKQRILLNGDIPAPSTLRRAAASVRVALRCRKVAIANILN